MSDYKIFNEDCIQGMKNLSDNSVDSIVTDPPYELGFMEKHWDSKGISYNVDVWKECFRVLKPGGHLLSFGGSRTYHRMACTIEDAGFEIRDQIMWVYGSGFPKSFNISKAIDKKFDVDETKAIKWDGWGTALKPAHEPICMARKPLSEKTIVDNILKYGTVGININECRVAINKKVDDKRLEGKGRFPANFIHDGSEEVKDGFPETKSGAVKKEKDAYKSETVTGFLKGKSNLLNQHGDSGNASRFFYCVKTTKADREEGLDNLYYKVLAMSKKAKAEVKRGNLHKSENIGFNSVEKRKNHHPTVKPTELMKYLCKLVTPENGTILDPFMGSGSTGKASILEGFNFIGYEFEEEYFNIAKERINYFKEKEENGKI